MKKAEIDELLNDKWYVQSGNLTPIYLMVAALSGFKMKKELGVGYSAFLFSSKTETGDLYYRVNDLERLYDFSFKEWEKDRGYFKKIRVQYINSQKPHQAFQNKIEKTELATISEKELIELINGAIIGITDSVGIGHLIEAIAIPSDEHLKRELKDYVKDEKELNAAFVALTTPVTKSFAQEAEDELREIGLLSKDKKKEAIRQYIKKWNWMRNSYAGRKSMREDEIMGEVSAIGRMKKNENNVVSEKERWVKKLGLNAGIVNKFEALSFVTDWQDERKKFILKAVDKMETLLGEYSRRTDIPLHDLRYAMWTDFNSDLPKRKAELAKRRAGMIYISTPEETVILTGKEYIEAIATLSKAHTYEGDELRGMAASLGTVRGRVKVCTTLGSLNEVEDGDILVASMTRPEYLPAMKKAAAFVTDEGGITCHAAIVAREMGKPCVIGTKVATKVLHDGDLVEVKGNHGVVIIKERAK